MSKQSKIEANMYIYIHICTIYGCIIFVIYYITLIILLTIIIKICYMTSYDIIISNIYYIILIINIIIATN